MSVKSAASYTSRKSTQSTTSTIRELRTGYVFLSYDWKHKHTIVKIKDRLEEYGIRVSIDIDPVKGTIKPLDQTALMGSSLVLIGLSSRYRENVVCQTEGELSHQLHKKIIVLQLEPDYFGTDWVKQVVQNRTLIDFTDEDSFETQMRILIKEVDTNMRMIDIRTEKSTEFPVNSVQDKQAPNITGIIGLPQNRLVVVDKDNRLLKLYSEDGTCLHTIDNQQETWGITVFYRNEFATCGFGKKVYLWKADGNQILRNSESYNIHWTGEAMHFNGRYFGIMHRRDYVITLLELDGKPANVIHLDNIDRRKIEIGWDIKLDRRTEAIYFPLFREMKGVMCINYQSETLWRCPLPGRPSTLVQISNVICVTDLTSKTVTMITQDGIHRGTLLGEEELEGGQPNGISHFTNGGDENKLLLCYNYFCKKRKFATVYQITHLPPM